jgi:hypothetical protein
MHDGTNPLAGRYLPGSATGELCSLVDGQAPSWLDSEWRHRVRHTGKADGGKAGMGTGMGAGMGKEKPGKEIASGPRK